MIPVISFVGRSGAGKTTYMEKLIVELTGRKIRVGVIKHDSHGFEIDQPGKDTWRHAQAGARVVCIASQQKFAMICKTEQETRLDEIVAMIRDVDLILVEGYRDQGYRLIEVYRQHAGVEALGRSSNLSAVVSDSLLYDGIPHFDVNEVRQLADVLEQELKNP